MAVMTGDFRLWRLSQKPSGTDSEKHGKEILDQVTSQRGASDLLMESSLCSALTAFLKTDLAELCFCIRICVWR
jgi:hypothetical protein